MMHPPQEEASTSEDTSKQNENTNAVHFASLSAVPLSTETTAAAPAEVVSFQDFVSSKSGKIIDYLGMSFVEGYETMSKPLGMFDYVSLRRKNIGPFNRMLMAYGMNYMHNSLSVIILLFIINLVCMPLNLISR